MTPLADQGEYCRELRIAPIPRSELIGYFFLAYAWTWIFWIPMALASLRGLRLGISQEALATLGQCGPLISALVWTHRVEGRSGLSEFLRGLVKWRIPAFWLSFALFFSPAAYLTSIWIHLHGVGAPLTFPYRIDAPEIVLNFLFVLVAGGPLGEEPGWRGYALPRLQRWWTPERSSVVLGLLWAGWHLPLWWVAQVPCPFGYYVIGIIPLSYLFTCLFNRSGGSILAALLFHASLNTALLRLPIFPAWAAWTAIVWVTAVVLYCFRGIAPVTRP